MRVFITGLTGTLGTALANLHQERGDEVVGCARSEARAVEWLRLHPGLANLVISDAFAVADTRSVISRELLRCNRLYHCAAMKHVDLCEKHPQEAIKQNVELTEVVAQTCFDISGIDFVLASTDKAFRPEGVYGATKLLAEKIALQHGGMVVRLVNLIGSSGSVLSNWQAAVKRGERIKLTDPDMTRYFMTAWDAAWLMCRVLDNGLPENGGPDGLPRMMIPPLVKAARMGDVANAIAGVNGVDVIGPRPGETKHQWLSDTLCSVTAERWDINELLREADRA